VKESGGAEHAIALDVVHVESGRALVEISTIGYHRLAWFLNQNIAG
jgi:hypothetical protein